MLKQASWERVGVRDECQSELSRAAQVSGCLHVSSVRISPLVKAGWPCLSFQYIYVHTLAPWKLMAWPRLWSQMIWVQSQGSHFTVHAGQPAASILSAPAPHLDSRAVAASTFLESPEDSTRRRMQGTQWELWLHPGRKNQTYDSWELCSWRNLSYFNDS